MSTPIRTALTGASILGVAYGAFAIDPRNIGDFDRPLSNSAVISNGTIKLGVKDEGHLNISGAGPISVGGTSAVGLRYILPSGLELEATAPGCLCEGWGAGSVVDGLSGYASVDLGGIAGLSDVTFGATASTAVSTAKIGGVLGVKHDYHPSTKTAYLYEATVTLSNLGADTITAPRYSRVMDWDVEPTPFSEFVTIKGTASTTFLIKSHDDGFETPAVGAFTSPILGGTEDVDFTDSGPADHGAYFLFEFPDLEPGKSFSFNIYYGAAPTEAAALAAIGSESIELYSLGQSVDDSLGLNPGGRYATFIFGFKGVGGTPIEPNPVIPEASTVVGAFGLVGLIGSSLWLRRRRQA